MLFFACRENNHKKSQVVRNVVKTNLFPAKNINAESIRADTTQKSKPPYPAWVDTLMIEYIRNTKNELVRNAFDKQKVYEEWLFDDTRKTDTATYWIFNVGHDVTDAGNTNLRFTADSWVYVDSLTKRIFEYDAGNETLTKWKKIALPAKSMP